MSSLLLRANALHLPVADNSIDLIVTSPPYYAVRSYEDGGLSCSGQLGNEPTPAEFVDGLVAATREMVRVLKPTGSIFINLGDKYPGRRKIASGTVWEDGLAYGMRLKSLMGLPWRYAIRCIDELELFLRAEIIWAKPNGLPESVTDRVARKHEQWFHFTKENRYFAAMDGIREPHAEASLQRAQLPNSDIERGWHAIDMTKACHPLGKLPGSVWTVPTEPLRVDPELSADHFAAFPVEFPRRIITGWCPEDGVVLDPFGGTGTTAAVARALGRTGVSVDLSADYLRIADWRCNGAGFDKIRAKIDGKRPPRAKKNKPMTLFGESQ